MTDTFARRLRESLLLVIVLLAAAGLAAGCTQAGNIRAKLSPSSGTGTSPVSSPSLAPIGPTATVTPTVQPSVTATRFSHRSLGDHLCPGSFGDRNAGRADAAGRGGRQQFSGGRE